MDESFKRGMAAVAANQADGFISRRVVEHDVKRSNHGKKKQTEKKRFFIFSILLLYFMFFHGSADLYRSNDTYVQSSLTASVGTRESK